MIVDRGELSLNGIPLRLTGTLRGVDGLAASLAGDGRAGLAEVPRTLELAVRVPDLPVETIRGAVPVALLGELEALRLAGTFGWDLDLGVDLERIGEMRWTSDIRLRGFAVREIPAAANPYQLNGSFVHRIEDPAVDYRRVIRIPTGRTPSLEWTLEHSEHSANWIARRRAEEAAQAARVAERPPRVVRGGAEAVGEDRADELRVDPSYRYVRLDEMSPWVVRAVLTAEDGDFFFHDGVNFYTLPRALERNVRAGEIAYGASTISMQLVKMLFLDQQRILARKLQEVFLVYLMEEHVPVAKPRILEIYLNVVEFGPGVFGIADAARYYFGDDPADLTAGEATWLASILPSPKRYHTYYESGWISDGWFERMKGYYDIMLERERMTSEEFEAAVSGRPVFVRGGR